MEEGYSNTSPAV